MGTKKRSREQQQFCCVEDDEGLFEPQRKLLISGSELLESFSDALAEPERLVLDLDGQAEEELLLSGAAEEHEECVSNLYEAPWALSSCSSDDCLKLKVGSRPIAQPFNQTVGDGEGQADAEYLFGASDGEELGISPSLGGTEFSVVSSGKDEGFPFASTPLDVPPPALEAWQFCDGDWSLDTIYAWESDEQEWLKRAVASLEMEPASFDQCTLESSVLEAGLAVL